MGLDRSIGSQYYLFIRGFVTGRWGFSYSTGLPVRTGDRATTAGHSRG